MTNYSYCIQCTDKISGKTGDFVYSSDKPFEAISPVFDDLYYLFQWMKGKYVEDSYSGDKYVPLKLKKIEG